MDFAGHLQKIHGVVAQTLEIADDVQHFGHPDAVRRGKRLRGQPHEPCAQIVFVKIQPVLLLEHAVGDFVVEFREQRQRGENRVGGQLGHARGAVVALADGHGGRFEQAFVQREGDRSGLSVVVYQPPGQADQEF